MNKFKKIIFLSAVTLFLGLSAHPLLAQETPSKGIEYVPLAPIPGLSTINAKGSTTSNTATFLPGLFKLIIGLATVLAVIRLLWGGLQYMTTDAWGTKE